MRGIGSPALTESTLVDGNIYYNVPVTLSAAAALSFLISGSR